MPKLSKQRPHGVVRDRRSASGVDTITSENESEKGEEKVNRRRHCEDTGHCTKPNQNLMQAKMQNRYVRSTILIHEVENVRDNITVPVIVKGAPPPAN